PPPQPQSTPSVPRRARATGCGVARDSPPEMRIGFDGTPLLGPKTGVGWYTHELIDAVARLAPQDDMVVFPISWRTARQLNLVPPHRPNVGVERKLAPARPLWALWDRVPFPPVEWLVNCNVFHATNFIAPPSHKVPTVVTVHDIGFVHHPEGVTPGVRRMARLLPGILRRASAIITVSQFTRQELVGWLPEVADRITVIPNGSHGRVANAPTSGARAEPPYALMLGTLEPRKNLPLALDALRILRRRGVDLRLVLAGSKSPLLDIPALLRKRGLGDPEVVRTGYIDDARVSALLAGARVLVFPSLYEGFGMPLLEAMESGVPIVAVRAGATPETVGDAGLLVEPGDAEAFADAMERAAFDEPLRHRLVVAGRAQAAKFTWERAAAASLELYRRVA
ncbi:MAG: glycosyltransferase family 4 protein, partial [Actinobacteria bacterium]|nr:glycosyltransferase family 4 protein [Actinomycetota bacterium]